MTAIFRKPRPRLTVAKLINAGQTCIAPDYVAVPRPMLAEFIGEMKKCCERFYPDIPANPDYTSIISDRHVERLHSLLRDAEQKGARIIPLGTSDKPLPERNIVSPTLVVELNDDMSIMQEEVFGPILPVLVYERPEELISYINASIHARLRSIGSEKIARYATFSSAGTVSSAALRSTTVCGTSGRK